MNNIILLYWYILLFGDLFNFSMAVAIYIVTSIPTSSLPLSLLFLFFLPSLLLPPSPFPPLTQIW